MIFTDPDNLHTASDINADQVRADLIADGHRSPDCAASASVDVRHHADLTALEVWLVEKIDNLRDRFIVNNIGEHFCRSIFSGKFDHTASSLKTTRILTIRKIVTRLMYKKGHRTISFCAPLHLQ